MDNQVNELDAINEALEEFKSVETGTEILVPVTGGVFAKAELKDNKKLTVNVGAGTSVEKTIPETLKLVSQQSEELSKTREELLTNLQEMVKKAHKIQMELKNV